MEEKQIAQELKEIKKGLEDLTKALVNNLESLQNLVVWEVGKNKIQLVSREKSIEELLAIARYQLETYKLK